MTKTPLRQAPAVIDLFAGCGGLSLGLEQAGFRPILCSELSESALDTYKVNRQGQDIAYYRDVYKLTNDELDRLLAHWRSVDGLEQVDLVCGGPPCQGYSGIGHRRTFKLAKEAIPSNHLYKEMARIVKKVQPKIFLFENVKGLLSSRWTKDGSKGEIWKAVKKEFRDVGGYTIGWKLVHAKDYGVPQNRPRVLLVGVHPSFAWPPAPDKDHDDAVEMGLLPAGGETPVPDLREALGDLVDPTFRFGGSTSRYPHRARGPFQTLMRRRPNGAQAPPDSLLEHDYSNHSAAVRAKFQHMIRHGGEIPASMRTKKFAQRVIPEVWGPNGPTITATSLPDDFVHWEQPRSLTVREWARIQTFPDWYRFMGPRTTGGHRRAGNPAEGKWEREVPKYTQIGNAVPVLLAKAIGRHFIDKILGSR